MNNALFNCYQQPLTDCSFHGSSSASSTRSRRARGDRDSASARCDAAAVGTAVDAVQLTANCVGLASVVCATLLPLRGQDEGAVVVNFWRFAALTPSLAPELGPFGVKGLFIEPGFVRSEF